MKKLSTKPASGMRDFLPDELRKRQSVFQVVRAVYESYGFEPLETPVMERLETLTGKYGEEGDQLMYKVLCRGQKLTKALEAGASTANDLADLALRYDLTVPLARVFAQYRNDLPKVFKRYQIAPVWRADRPQRGRYREFFQCDVDVVGSRCAWVEAECLSALSEALRRLRVEGFRIHLNHRALLHAAIEAAGIESSLETSTLVAMDKLDKIGRDGVMEEFLRRGIEADQGLRLMEILSPDGFSLQVGEQTDILAHLENHLGELATGRVALAELRQVLALAAVGPAGQYLCVDPTLARGLSYYTGPIFEIQSDDFAGSLGGGGRYDGLIGTFTNQEVPACGFSLGLERIVLLMDERGLFEELPAPSDALVTVYDESLAAPSLALAYQLREAGLRVDVYSTLDKLGKQFRFASERKIPTALVLGPDEFASGLVTVKNLVTREQRTVSQDEAAAVVTEFIRPA
jgi:histidyl-tRNA synthetase